MSSLTPRSRKGERPMTKVCGVEGGFWDSAPAAAKRLKGRSQRKQHPNEKRPRSAAFTCHAVFDFRASPAERDRLLLVFEQFISIPLSVRSCSRPKGRKCSSR